MSLRAVRARVQERRGDETLPWRERGVVTPFYPLQGKRGGGGGGGVERDRALIKPLCTNPRDLHEYPLWLTFLLSRFFADSLTFSNHQNSPNNLYRQEIPTFLGKRVCLWRCRPWGNHSSEFSSHFTFFLSRCLCAFYLFEFSNLLDTRTPISNFFLPSSVITSTRYPLSLFSPYENVVNVMDVAPGWAKKFLNVFSVRRSPTEDRTHCLRLHMYIYNICYVYSIWSFQ